MIRPGRGKTRRWPVTKKVSPKDKATKPISYPEGLAALARSGATTESLRRCHVELALAVKVMIGHAVVHIALCDSRADDAQRFLRDIEAITQRFHKRHVAPTRLEGVLGALGSMASVVLTGGGSELFSDHTTLAKELLRNKREQRDFDGQVSELAKRLDVHFQGWKRLPDDPIEAVEQAFKVAAVDPYNVIAAPAKMRAHREREKTTTQPAKPKRRPRST